jgi:hypothetical protein
MPRASKHLGHYQAFMQVNTTSKCPFCGIGDIKGAHLRNSTTEFLTFTDQADESRSTNDETPTLERQT